MSDTRDQTIATNVAYLFFSQILTWALSLAVAIALPRYFGATDTGAYFVASSLWNITALLVGFGTDLVINREIARDPDKTSELVWVGVLLRVLFHFVGFTSLAIFVHFAGYAPETVLIVYVLGIANLIYQIGHMFSAALYGLEKMGSISFVDVVTELVSSAGILVLVLAGQSIVVVSATSVLAGSIHTILLFMALRRNYPLRYHLNLALIPDLLRESATILGSRLVRSAYSQADVIIISLFVNETVVGWYSVADIAYGSLLFVPVIMSTALFPSFARLYQEDEAELVAVARQALRRLLVAAVPIALGTAVVATPVLVLVVGEEFEPAGLVLSGFGIVTFFTAINTLFSRLLIAMDRQNRLTAIMALAIALTYPIDFFLIPFAQTRWGNGALGGVISYLITESTITLAIFLSLPIPVLNASLVRFTLKALLAGAIMVSAVWPLRERFVAVPILIGMIVYGGVALSLRLVTREDLVFLGDVLKRIWNRVRNHLPTRFQSVR